jgi:hypothetical protein
MIQNALNDRGRVISSGVKRVCATGILLLLALLSYYYFWRPSSSAARTLTLEPVGLYHELTDAFLSGHTFFNKLPDEELSKLSDPYDPMANVQWRRDNLSYFRGRYYLYHSAVPVIVLFLPIKVLTGRYLAEDTAIAIFSILEVAAGMAALYSLRQHSFPKSPASLFWLSMIALSAGGAQFAILRDASVNHVAIASASCFLVFAFAAGLQSQFSLRHSNLWLALTGLFQALAVVSRPNYIYGAFGVVLLVLPFAYDSEGRLKKLGNICSAWLPLLLPIVLIAGLTAWYNFARFGSLTDFGARYMLGAWDQRHLPAASLHGLADNAWYYFLAPGVYDRYFPFVAAPTWRSIGVFPHLPFLLFACVLVIPAVRSPMPFTAYVAFVVIANTISLLILPSGNEVAVLTSANSRYLPDFVTALGFLACMGVLAAGEACALNSGFRKTLIASVSLFAVWSVLANLSLDFQRLPSRSYRVVSEVLDWPASLFEVFVGEKYGPISLDVRFPQGRTGQTDPLLVTGDKGDYGLLYVTYLSDNSVLFGLARTAKTGPVSAPFPLDYSRRHEIKIWTGSLYPPIGHPAAFRLSTAQITFARRLVRVDVDGINVFESVAFMDASTPDRVLIGKNPLALAPAQLRFQGDVFNVTRLPITGSIRTQMQPTYGDVDLTVLLPRDKVGTAEPLVVTGEPNAGDFIYISYIANGVVQIGYDHWGHRPLLSKPIAVDFAIAHQFDVSIGSLYPNAYDRHEVRICIDGADIMTSRGDPFDASPFEVSIGRNPIGGSSCGYEFTGKILRMNRVVTKQHWP